MIVVSEENIRELAYKIWQQTGRENSIDNWINAKNALEWYSYQPHKKTLRKRLQEFISRKWD